MRTIKAIAYEISRDPMWKAKGNGFIGAAPYLEAMHHIEHVSDRYIAEGADDIVLRFLSNAHHYRGETARKVKAELNDLLTLSKESRATHEEVARRNRSAMPGRAKPLPEGWYGAPKGWDKV